MFVILLFQIPFVNALTGQYAFNKSTYKLGDYGMVRVTLYNDCPLFQWHIKEVDIQFDWEQDTKVFLTVNQNIAPGQSYSKSINFEIDSNVLVGLHSFSIKYVGLFNDRHTVVSGNIYVREA